MDSVIEKIDEELANMRTSKDANVQVYNTHNTYSQQYTIII